MRALPLILFVVAVCVLYKMFVNLLSSRWLRTQIEELRNPTSYTDQEMIEEFDDVRARTDDIIRSNEKDVQAKLSSNKTLKQALEN